MSKINQKNLAALAKLFSPRTALQRQGEDEVRDWHEHENEFCHHSLSLTLMLLGAIMPLFVFLDISHSPNSNPTLVYSMLHRCIPGIFFFSYGLLLRDNYRPLGQYSFVLHKSVVLLCFLMVIAFQFRYSVSYPDRIRVYPPLIMVLGVFLTRTGPAISGLVIIGQLLLWATFSGGSPEYFKADASYQLFSVILCLVLLNNSENRAKVFFSQKDQMKALRDRTEILKDKEILLRVVCHDVLNPLGVILGYLDMSKMFKQKLDPDWRETIDGIETASSSIHQLLTDVRDLESLRCNKKDIKKEPVRIQEVLDDVVFCLDRKAKEKDLVINIKDQLQPNTLALVDTKSFGMNVFGNILTNAIKFSFRGSTIDVSLEEEDSGILVSIQDYGSGMPASLQKQIFEPDVATTRKGTEGEAGTGFGMPIVKSYLDRLEGGIEVRSSNIEEFPEDHGTCFNIHLKKAA